MPYAEDFRRVDDAINGLARVHSKAQLNLDDLEEVFGAFEMAKVIGRFPGLQSESSSSRSEEIDKILRSFRNVITSTLEESIRYPIVDGLMLQAPPSYAKFAALLNQIQKDDERPRCAVITFNYDIALDVALNRQGIDIDYGLGDNTDPRAMPYLKLHGSLNWFTTRTSPTTVKPWYLREFFRKIRATRTNSTQLRLSQLVVQEQPFVNEQVDPTPAIVPPTWNKTAYQAAIASVWSRAATELSDAEQVFVSGYSLIATDAYFKYLFALGSVGPSRIRSFSVYDPDQNVKPRFEKLLGPGVHAFHFATNPFSGFVELVNERFTKAAAT